MANETVTEQTVSKHPTPALTTDMTAEQYVAATLKLRHSENPKGFLNGGLLRFARWIGDASLAVIPKNRFSCALGLTAGGALGLFMGKLLSGRELSGYKEVAKEAYPKILQPLHGMFKFDPLSNAMGDRWRKLGAFYAFTALSFAGIMIGAWTAYRGFYKRNENPSSLEDYVARAAQHQGSKWRWLAASSGVFGSAAGYYTLPFVPGVNYGSSIAFYTVLNQDRKVMTPGLKVATGTKTNSYLGLREGLDYLCKYAVHNISQTPAELEYLALTILGPLAHAADLTLSAEHIQKFVNKLHAVRDTFWQEGGIPDEHKKAAMKALEEHFKGKGLDKTLYDAGFDTLKINFTKMNGLIGKLGNRLGAASKIEKDQAAYRTLVGEWRSEWKKKPEKVEPEERSPLIEPDATPSPFITQTEPKKSAPLAAALARPQSHTERAATPSETALRGA